GSRLRPGQFEGANDFRRGNARQAQGRLAPGSALLGFRRKADRLGADGRRGRLQPRQCLCRCPHQPVEQRVLQFPARAQQHVVLPRDRHILCAGDDQHRAVSLRVLSATDVADPLAALADQTLCRRVARRPSLLPAAIAEWRDRQPRPAHRRRSAPVHRLCPNLSLGLLTSVVSFFSFLFILWNLSGPAAIPLGSWGTIQIPAYLVWTAIVYAGIGSWLTMKIGRPLIGLNFLRQRFEADFRFSLIRLRENAESVALFRG